MTVFPIITSTLSAKELGDFIVDLYELNGSFDCKLLRTGMNHTYALSSKQTKYVLRVYSHNWRSKSEILEELALLNLLKEKKINISFPIEDKKGDYIQTIQAPEGTRYIVLFSFAKGEKIRFMDKETCFSIGLLMAKIHSATSNKTIKRISYNKNSLLAIPYKNLKQFFSEKLPEMNFIRELGETFQDADFENAQNGIVHMDIWYDNMAVANENKITLFDFDFCGSGWQILDIGYFCKQLFHIESDKSDYEIKMQSFLEGYQSITLISDNELKLIPRAGLAVFVFYLGIQAQRFDWSNIFLSENYLKMYVGKLKSWMDYNNIKK